MKKFEYKKIKKFLFKKMFFTVDNFFLFLFFKIMKKLEKIRIKSKKIEKIRI